MSSNWPTDGLIVNVMGPLSREQGAPVNRVATILRDDTDECYRVQATCKPINYATA